MAITITEGNFKREVLDSPIPVLVDFWAEWCGPCKMIATIIDEISGEYAGKIKVCKLNVDQDGKVASQYSISAIPTLVIFKNGQPVEHMIGAQSKKVIVEKINKHCPPSPNSD